MTVFDSLYLNVFNHFKKRFKSNTNLWSVIYITLLQISIIFLLGVFFSEFLNQMKVNTMSSEKAWSLFVVISIILYFLNWMSYTGKKRNIIKARTNRNNSLNYKLWVLLLLPISIIFLSILLLKVL
jgi:hypothetical protein